jgi:hypothetical protein
MALGTGCATRSACSCSWSSRFCTRSGRATSCATSSRLPLRQGQGAPAPLAPRQRLARPQGLAQRDRLQAALEGRRGERLGLSSPGPPGAVLSAPALFAPVCGGLPFSWLPAGGHRRLTLTLANALNVANGRQHRKSPLARGDRRTRACACGCCSRLRCKPAGRCPMVHR